LLDNKIDFSLYFNSSQPSQSPLLEKGINNKYTILSVVYPMSQSEWFTTYLEYESIEDMLKVILFSSQSVLGFNPLLYHIKYKNSNSKLNDKEILFIVTGTIGGVVVHYFVDSNWSKKKFIQLKKLTGEYNFVENIGADPQSLFIPILELKRSTLRFPTDDTYG